MTNLAKDRALKGISSRERRDPNDGERGRAGMQLSATFRYCGTDIAANFRLLRGGASKIISSSSEAQAFDASLDEKRDHKTPHIFRPSPPRAHDILQHAAYVCADAIHSFKTESASIGLIGCGHQKQEKHFPVLNMLATRLSW